MKYNYYVPSDVMLCGDKTPSDIKDMVSKNPNMKPCLYVREFHEWRDIEDEVYVFTEEDIDELKDMLPDVDSHRLRDIFRECRLEVSDFEDQPERYQYFVDKEDLINEVKDGYIENDAEDQFEIFLDQVDDVCEDFKEGESLIMYEEEGPCLHIVDRYSTKQEWIRVSEDRECVRDYIIGVIADK